jgi:CHAT domain-containing protein/Tfp pilus assembly protein PilF
MRTSGGCTRAAALLLFLGLASLAGADVVVDDAAAGFEAARAGLRAGDVLRAWSCGERHGEIASPFDVPWLEVEQVPRGRVVLSGARGAVPTSWTLGSDQWRLRTRPATPSMDAPWLAAWQRFEAARVAAEAKRWAEADEDYAAALKSAAEAGPSIAAQVLQAHAAAFEQRSDWPQAEKLYQQAIEEWGRVEAETLSAAASMNGLGNVARLRGDLAAAEQWHRRALAIQEKLAPNSVAVAKSLIGLGAVADYRGDLGPAQQVLERALAIAEAVAPESLLVADSLNGLGNVVIDRGDLARAEEDYRRSWTIRARLVPGSLDVAVSLNNLGYVAFRQGDLAKAEGYHEQALAIRTALAPDSIMVAWSLYNLEVVMRDRGDLARAEDYGRRALAIHQKLGPHSIDTAMALVQISAVAMDRNEVVRAKDDLQQAVAILRKAAPEGRYIAHALNWLGCLSRHLGELDKAEEYQREALANAEKVAPGGNDVAVILHDLGEVAASRGDMAQAEEYERRAEAIVEKVTPVDLAHARMLRRLGEFAQARHDLATAEARYRRSLALLEALAPETLDHAQTLTAFARLAREKGDLPRAAELLEGALAAFEHHTERVGGADAVRSGLRADYSETYREYADVLIAQGRPERAFEVIERSRARTLLEMLRSARVDVRRGVPPELLEKERAARRALSAASDRRRGVLAGSPGEEQAAAAGKQVDTRLAELRAVEGEIRATSPGYAALTQPQPFGLEAIQHELLDADTVLLEYALGDEASSLWVVTPDKLVRYGLPARGTIEPLARRFYELLKARDRTVSREGASARRARIAAADAELNTLGDSLGRLLLAPASDAGVIKGKRLAVVSDGILQYVPFVALRDPAASAAVPLIADHEVVTLPSASVLAELRRASAGRRAPDRAVAVLADPVFDRGDPRVRTRPPVVAAATMASRGVSAAVGPARLPRLAFTRQEAVAIEAATPAGQGMAALDFDASRATALGPELARYRVVHFATHGFLDGDHPELSGLALSLVDRRGAPQNGWLELEDIYNLDLPADLVVLSACQTGLGKDVKGEGLVGLTRGFMYAGASRVVASLWNIDDVATAELMGRFYREMEQAGMRPAAALRQAQVQMWQQRRWSAPYYWAAFQIHGDWR